MHFGRTVGVVFPGEYGKRNFGKDARGTNKAFFTPDTNLIRSIDQKVFNQYCNAIETYWQKYLDGQTGDSTHRSGKAAALAAKKYCTLWKETFPFYDRQYVGYTTTSGERIIIIKFLDFRQDPYQLKPSLAVSWIDGWHGWFYSNVVQLFYHVGSNTLTLEEGS